MKIVSHKSAIREADVRLTMRERQSVTAVVSARYRKSRRKDKEAILNEFVRITGYNRDYGAYLLRAHGKRLRVDNKTVLVGSVKKKTRRSKPRMYGDMVLDTLKKIWVMMDCICGKRLGPALSELIPILEEHDEIELDGVTKQKLLRISAATIRQTPGSREKEARAAGKVKDKARHTA